MNRLLAMRGRRSGLGGVVGRGGAAESAPRHLSRRSRSRRRQAHRVSRRRPRVPRRRVAPRARANPRQTLRVHVQRVLHDRSEDRVHRARQLQHCRARGAHARPTCSSCFFASRTFPMPRCSTSWTTSIAAVRWWDSARRPTRFRSGAPDAKFVKYTWNNKDADYPGGFGRQILGETWVSHYGTNHKQSSRLRARRPIRPRIRSCAASRTSGRSPAATRPIRWRAARCWRSARS